MGRGRRSGFLGSLCTLIIFAIGVVNWHSSSKYVDYYNQYAVAAYNSIAVEQRNKWVEIADAPDSSYDTVKQFMEGSLIPVSEGWLKKADILTPPGDAEGYHDRFTKGLRLLVTDAKKLVVALGEADKDTVDATVARMGAAYATMDKDLLELQDTLKKTHDLNFESSSQPKP